MHLFFPYSHRHLIDISRRILGHELKAGSPGGRSNQGKLTESVGSGPGGSIVISGGRRWILVSRGSLRLSYEGKLALAFFFLFSDSW